MPFHFNTQWSLELGFDLAWVEVFDVVMLDVSFLGFWVGCAVQCRGSRHKSPHQVDVSLSWSNWSLNV